LPRTVSEVERGGTFLIFSYEKFIQQKKAKPEEIATTTTTTIE